MQSFKSHDLPVDSVLLSHPTKDSNQYLQLTLQVFPSAQDWFNRTGVLSIGFLLSNQTFKPNPQVYGPCFFIGDTYGYFENYGKYPSTLHISYSIVVINDIYLSDT